MSVRTNVVAYSALFIALGGTAYAAVRPPTDSVGTSQLRNGAVTAAKVRAHALTLRDLAHGSVGTAQLADGAVTMQQIQPHSLTAAAFAPGTLPTTTPQLHTVIVGYAVGPGSAGPDPNPATTLPVDCPAGTQAVGGGFNIPSSDQANETVTASEPLPANSSGPAIGWTVTFTYTGSEPHAPFGSVYAVCAATT